MDHSEIYRFSSFKDYFNFWISQQLSMGKSLGQIARNLKLYSNAEITNVLKGRRKVSYKILEKFKNYNRFSNDENYYLDLIAESDRNTSSTTLYILIKKEIAAIQGQKVKFSENSPILTIKKNTPDITILI